MWATREARFAAAGLLVLAGRPNLLLNNVSSAAGKANRLAVVALRPIADRPAPLSHGGRPGKLPS
jgi:hypothetical protein